MKALPAVWSRWAPSLVATALVLLPFWRLFTFHAALVTDDQWISDVWNGEFPTRVALTTHPLWDARLGGGFPVMGFGLAGDPLSAVLFRVLPPLAALDAFLLVVLTLATVGAVRLAQTMGASARGAVLAGLSFGLSGYMVCQLRRMGVTHTVAWMPWCLAALHRSFHADTRDATLRGLRDFAVCFKLQLLAGFPQCAQIGVMVYGACAVTWSLARWRAGDRATLAGAWVGFVASGIVAAMAAMVMLVPLWSLGQVSDRARGVSSQMLHGVLYWSASVLTFFRPYVWGDGSDNSFVGPSLFAEDYAYVGLATVLLAGAALVFVRPKRDVLLLALVGLAAYGLVVGAGGEYDAVVRRVLPGMRYFRTPTRFLSVVSLALSVLGGLGLSALEARLAARRRTWAVGLGALVVTATTLDLWHHQPRQNAIVEGHAWMDAPPTVRWLRSVGTARDDRVYTPLHRSLHRATFERAGGWAHGVEPYAALRDFVEPSANLHWDVPVADFFAGIAPSWSIDAWGDHHRTGMVHALMAQGSRGVVLTDAFVQWMRVAHVRWVLTRRPLASPPQGLVARGCPGACVSEVAGRLGRARIVPSHVVVRRWEEAARVLAMPGYDPSQVVMLAPVEGLPRAGGVVPEGAAWRGAARLVNDEDTRVVVAVDAPAGGWLVLSDTFDPGWRAEVDGRAAEIVRADVMYRAVRVPPGARQVVFRYAPAWWPMAKAVSGLGLALVVALGVWVGRRR